MVLGVIKKVIFFVPNKLVAINSSVNKVINFLETTEKTFPYLTKVIGATTGVAADGLQICTSFIPGPK